MVAMLVGVVRHAQVEAIRMRSYGRLSQLRLALANYEHACGILPPRQLIGENGVVQFNWMVPVLPYMEQRDLHTALNLSNSWNTKHNLDVGRSNSLFLDFVSRDGYIACPLDDDESIWNPRTGLPNGKLDDSPGSILLIAVPVGGIQPFEPLAISRDGLQSLALKDNKCFFIRCDGKYGPVQVLKGNVEFELP